MKKAAINGIPVLPCLYTDINNRISIRKLVSGTIGLKKAYKENPKQIYNLIYKVGFYLGKLHSIGLVFGDWKPEHIVFDLKNNKIYLIDYEQMKNTSDVKNFVNEINGKFKCYFLLAIPDDALKPLWQSFINGYNNCGWQKAGNILSKTSNPKSCCRIYKYFLTFFRKIDLSVGKLSRGYLKL